MNIVVTYFPLLAQGICVTAAAWLAAAVCSITLGTALGIISCRRLGFSTVRKAVHLYTFIFKGIPAYVQILIAYFALPAVLNISLSGFTAATGALALCSTGYVTEIVRAGMNSVPPGQWDAGFVLGYSRLQTVRYIILPQAFPTILPALLGELEQLLKSTSLLATIGVTEVTRAGMNIISRELTPLPVYLIIACIYLAFSAVLTLAGNYIERKATHGCR